MSLDNEIAMLMRSDVSGAAIDQLVSPFGLWVRNSLIHTGAGFVAFFGSVYASWPLRWVMPAYCILQIVQVFTAILYVPAIIDGLWDVASAGAGYVLAWSWATSEPKRAR